MTFYQEPQMDTFSKHILHHLLSKQAKYPLVQANGSQSFFFSFIHMKIEYFEYKDFILKKSSCALEILVFFPCFLRVSENWAVPVLHLDMEPENSK